MIATLLVIALLFVGTVSAAKPEIGKLPAPKLVSPADGAVLSDYPVSLTWAEVRGASIYFMEVDFYKSGTWDPYYGMGTSAKTEQLTYMWRGDGEYRWRITAQYGIDDTVLKESRPSRYRYFTFTSPTCVLPEDSWCGSDCMNLQLDPNNCGACGNACWAPNVAGYSCNSGACSIASCSGDYLDCDGDFTNGCEVDGSTADNCGSCGNVCPAAANAVASCQAGSCAFLCNSPFADCDGDPTNGCETDTTTDEANCGACGTACSTTYGSSECISGLCGMTDCDSGWDNCNYESESLDGCERDVTTIDNCGGCDYSCNVPNADPACTLDEWGIGSCSISLCNEGYDDCNADDYDGCEVYLYDGVFFDASEVDNCGSCGHDCVNPHGSASCSNGECSYPSCDEGYADCEWGEGISSLGFGVMAALPSGCETNIYEDIYNCGSCYYECPIDPDYPDATITCVSGTCHYS